MGKKLAVGHTIEKLKEHFECYNPYKALPLRVELSSQDKIIYSKLEAVNYKVYINLKDLFSDMLLFRNGNVTLKAIEIIELLKKEYEPLINSFSSKKAEYAKILFKEWRLEWMLNYIKDAVFFEDWEFAEKYNLSLTRETFTVLKNLKDYYIDEEEEIED